jgi:hypothetical protein
MKDHKKPQTWTDTLDKRSKRKKMNMKFGTCNVRSVYMARSLRAVAEEISKYRLDLVGVQQVRWGRGGTEPAGEHTFFYGEGNGNHELGTGFSYIRESYQQSRGWSLLVIGCHTYYVRGRWCDIIVLNVHAPTDDKIDDMKDSGTEIKCSITIQANQVATYGDKCTTIF